MKKNLFLSCVDSHVDDPKNTYARFKIGPFEQNHTLTIANNLRRALLSELDGIAIAAAKIQGVSHEYSALPGVRESVLDILLNLKKVVVTGAFKIHSPHIAYLRCSGPGIVKAGDIHFPPYLKCIDPEQPIATLCADGQLNMILFICPGKNYWVQSSIDGLTAYCGTAEPNGKSKVGLTLTREAKRFIQLEPFGRANILPIDAVFMPINRVNYQIEMDEEVDTEVPEEHIFMEIWTNGSIHPIQAIQSAAQSLVGMFEPFQNLQPFQPVWLDHKAPKGQILTRPNDPRVELGRYLPEIEDGENSMSSVLDLDIGNLELSLRPFACLKRANIHNIRTLLEFSREELLLFKNFGKRSLEEVESSLFKMGLFLPKKEKPDKNLNKN